MRPYSKIRPEIHTGDAILFQGNGIISRMIRHWSDMSHAALVIRLRRYSDLGGRVFLVEALSHGLKLRLLSDVIRGYNGRIFHLGMGASKRQRLKILEFALTECATTEGYDYEGLFGNIFGRVNRDARRYFCSEWVWFAWEFGGVIPKSSNMIKAPTPGDLVKWVEYLARPEEIATFSKNEGE